MDIIYNQIDSLNMAQYWPREGLIWSTSAALWGGLPYLLPMGMNRPNIKLISNHAMGEVRVQHVVPAPVADAAFDEQFAKFINAARRHAAELDTMTLFAWIEGIKLEDEVEWPAGIDHNGVILLWFLELIAARKKWLHYRIPLARTLSRTALAIDEFWEEYERQTLRNPRLRNLTYHIRTSSARDRGLVKNGRLEELFHKHEAFVDVFQLVGPDVILQSTDFAKGSNSMRHEIVARTLIQVSGSVAAQAGSSSEAGPSFQA